jgi:FtsH-binding integral membrane protein
MSTYAHPLARASAADRVEYLQRVLLWTSGGLFVSGITGAATALGLSIALSMGITLLFNQWVSLAIIFGSYGIAHYAAPRMVFGNAKVLGFGVGAVFQGISMGYLLLYAVLLGAQMGNPFGMVGTALGLTAMTGVGLTAYVWTGPKNFGWLGAGLSALFLPMLLLMGVSFVFPGLLGGPLGIAVSGLFVLVSVGGLLYQINVVMHKLNTRQHIEGAYMITMGVLILFWNILSLLMRLNRR